MKRLICLVICVFLLSGCGPKKDEYIDGYIDGYKDGYAAVVDS